MFTSLCFGYLCKLKTSVNILRHNEINNKEPIRASKKYQT